MINAFFEFRPTARRDRNENRNHMLLGGKMFEVAVSVLAAAGILFLIEGARGSRKTKTLDQFFLLGGKLKLKNFVGTLAATNFSLGNLIFLAMVWGYMFGLSAVIWISSGFFLSVFIFNRFISRNIKAHNYINNPQNSGSVHEFLQISYSDSAKTAALIRLTASTASIFSLILALTLELYLSSTILSELASGQEATVFVVITCIICAYSSMGGFSAVVRTDIIQGFMLLFSMLLVLIYFSTASVSGADYASAYPIAFWPSLAAPGFPAIVALIGMTLGWFLVTMDTWQRAAASRSAIVSRKAMWFGLLILVFGTAFFGGVGVFDRLFIFPNIPAGMASLHSSGFNPVKDLILFGGSFGFYGNFVLGFFCAALITAGLSTADTFLIVCSHSFVSDVLIGTGRRIKYHELSSEEQDFFVSVGRSAVVFMGMAVVGMYFFLDYIGGLEDPLTLFYLSYSVQFALFGPVVWSYFGSASSRSVILSLSASVIAVVTWGFGFFIATRYGFEGFFWLPYLTGIELVYLTPLVPMLVGVGTLIVAAWSRRMRHE